MKWFCLVGVLACGARSEIGGVIVGSDAGALDGNPNGCVDEEIAHDASGATGLAVDGDTVFWCTSDGTIERHDASGNTVLGETHEVITALAFDVKNVYATTDDGTLVSVPRGGGAITTVASSLGQPFALVVKDDTFFYVNYGAGILAGSVVALGPIESPSSLTIVDQLDTPGGLAVDGTNVYVTAAMTLVNQASVMAPILSAKRNVVSTAQSLVVLATANEPHAVAVDDARVYYVDQSDSQFSFPGALYAVPKSGGATTKLGEFGQSLPLEVAVDSSSAWVNTLTVDDAGDASSSLFRVALDGSGESTFASDPNRIIEVRTNATAVYYTIAWPTTSPPQDGVSVRKKCK